jgi:hypothetical protein
MRVGEFVTVNCLVIVPTIVCMELACKPVAVFCTTIGVIEVAPAGTVTVSEVVVPAVGVALIAPKYTALLAGVALKFVPVMVTVVPIVPEVGVKEVILGACALASCTTHKKK